MTGAGAPSPRRRRVADIRRQHRRAWMLGAGVFVVVVALFIVMTPQVRLGTATLAIDSDPPGAEVKIDGVSAGVTPLKKRVISGEHDLRVEHPYHKPYQERIHVGRGDVIRRTLVLGATHGSLVLMSNPRGAWIELNGVRQQQPTPARFEDLIAGKYTVRVGTADHRPVSVDVEVLPDQTTERVIELQPVKKGQLTIVTDPDDASITLPDVDVGYTEAMSLPVGTYRVRVKRDGYATKTVSVVVSQEQNLDRITLDRLYGRLHVTVSPRDATVLVTYSVGRDVIKVPYSEDMRIPTGKVDVRAEAMGRRTQVKDLDLGTAGARIRFTLAKLDVEPGSTFRDPLEDGSQGPLMVVIPAGSFRMGSDAPAASQGERPVHEVTLTQPFAVSVNEITRAEYAHFVRATGRHGMPTVADEEKALPVVHVEYEDAVAYAQWLSDKSNEHYRLLSEAEWEYVARAGTKGTYFFGENVDDVCRYANIADARTEARFNTWHAVECDDGYAKLAPVGRFEPNPFGVHDIYGNVAEWVSDCWHFGYEGAPADGSSWISHPCDTRVVRGGAWDSRPDDIRSSARYAAAYASDDRGIRLARDL